MKGVNFENLLRSGGVAPVTVVAGGASVSVLELVRRAPGIRFVLVDSREAVCEAGRVLGEDVEGRDNCEVVEPEAGLTEEFGLCLTASELCRRGETAVLMKGRVHTAAFLRALLSRQSRMVKPGNVLSHAALFSPPEGQSRNSGSFLVTDSAVNVLPSLKAKKRILANAVQAARALGTRQPFIALLAPVEVSTDRIRSTTDARELKEWLRGGALGECTADGPLPLDAAASARAARIKGIDSPVAGRTDIYLAPNLDSGNILYKALSVFAGFRVAGVLLGASVPVVLTSRSDDAEARLASLGLSIRIAASPFRDNLLAPE